MSRTMALTIFVVLVGFLSVDGMNVDFAKKMARSRLEKEGLPDPVCRTGIISLPISSLGKKQACCPAYCKECDDYKTCESVRGQDSKNACCASSVLELECGKGAPANICLKKCSDALPPCIMEDGQVWKLKPPKVNAADDCNEAISEWRQHGEAAIKAGNEAVEAWEAKMALNTLKKVLETHKKMVEETEATIKEMKAEAAADKASLEDVETTIDMLSEEIEKAEKLHDIMAKHLLEGLKEQLQNSTSGAKDSEKDVTAAIDAIDSAKDKLVNYLAKLEGQAEEVEGADPKILLDKKQDIELVHAVAKEIRNLQFEVADKTDVLETDMKDADATAKKAKAVIKEYLTTTTTTTSNYKGVYILKSVLAGTYANVDGRNTDNGMPTNNGANIITWDSWWFPGTQWRISGDQASYTLENIGTGGYLNIQDDSTQIGGNIHQWDNPGDPSTQWTIAPAATDGAVLIANKRSGMLCNIQDDSHSIGANLHQWNNPGDTSSQWYLEPLPQLSGKTFHIKSVLADKYLNVADASRSNGGNMEIRDNPDSTTTHWTIQGEQGKYNIQNYWSGLFLNLQDDSISNGGNIHQWDNPGNPSTQWTISYKGSGVYYIVNIRSGKFVNIQDDSTSNGANVHQWDNPENPSSQWYLEEVTTTTTTTVDDTTTTTTVDDSCKCYHCGSNTEFNDANVCGKASNKCGPSEGGRRRRRRKGGNGCWTNRDSDCVCKTQKLVQRCTCYRCGGTLNFPSADKCGAASNECGPNSPKNGGCWNNVDGANWQKNGAVCKCSEKETVSSFFLLGQNQTVARLP